MNIHFNQAAISAVDQKYVQEAIASGHISGNGIFTRKVEALISEITLASRVLLTTSCTHSIEIAALLCSLEPGDEIIVPSYTFVSTASSFALFGARPVFVDSRSDTLNIDATLIERSITPRTKAICVVHYGGVACEMEKILELVEAYDLVLIEDNAHGLFAKYQGRYLGSFGSLATQSFHETKNITCGEGGALLINDEALIDRAEILREKGTDRSRFLRGQVDKYTWVDIGSSWVLSEILAAILWGQLQRANEINARRVAIWNLYDRELSEWAATHGVLKPFVPLDCEHVGHLYHLRFLKSDQRTRFITHMREHEISCVFHYQPLHLSPVGQRFGGFAGQCPISEHAGDCLVRLPMHGALRDSDLERIINAVQQFVP